MTRNLVSELVEPIGSATKTIPSSDSIQLVECLARNLDFKSAARRRRVRTRVKVRVRRRREVDLSALVVCVLTALACLHIGFAAASNLQKSAVAAEIETVNYDSSQDVIASR